MLPHPALLPLPEANAKAPASYSGPTSFRWAIRGRLGGMRRPGLTNCFDTDLDALARLGVTHVVSLTKEWEPPAEAFALHGLSCVYMPIPDMKAPALRHAVETCATLAEALDRGGAIVFHCRGGRGRTGTMIAAMLLWYQPDFEAAVAHVRSAEPAWIESDAQMDFLRQFARIRRTMLGLPKQGVLVPPRDKYPTHPVLGSHDTTPHPPTLRNTGENMSLDVPNTLDQALKVAMTGIPECLASGYVDIDSGMLLGIQTIDSHPQEVLDLLAAATADLFQGSSVTQIENIFKASRGTDTEDHYFNEILVFSENLIHMFIRTKKYPEHVIVFVCQKSANPGMVMTKARMSLEAVTSTI